MSIISGGLSLLTGGASFLSGAKYWVIALALATAIAGAAGYYKGYTKATGIAEDKLVAAQMEMYNKGVTAQKNFSDHQFEVASKDFSTRLAALQKQKQKVITITETLHDLVPQVAACTVSPAAMKALNDVVTE